VFVGLQPQEVIMSATDGVLRVHVDGQTVTFQVEGQATVRQGLPLRRYAEECLSGSGPASLRIDLRRCTWMDSTFLGTLLLLLKAVNRKEQGSFAVVSPTATAQRLLHQMGMTSICPVLEREEPTGPWLQVDGPAEDGETFQCRVLQAHQELADLPGPAGEAFRAVVRCLNASRQTAPTT
jgi:anti-anti-sigma factor